MKEKYPIDKIFIISALAVLFIASIVSPVLSKERENQILKDLRENYENNEYSKTAIIRNPFSEIDLEAKSVFIWDIKNQKPIFEQNADEVRPLASISKMLLAAVSTDILPPNTQITIESEFLGAEGDTGLLASERWTLKDLLDFSLLVSSNDGARAIASVAGAKNLHGTDYESGREEFIRLMNKKAQSWGMASINIINEAGLDSEEDKSQSGAYGTAREIALMFERLLLKYPQIIETTRESQLSLTSLSNIEHSAINTNQTVNSIPGITASKTGYTDLAGGNLAIIFDPSIGRPMVVVVLGSTFEDRFSDVEKLVKATREYVIQEKVRKIMNEFAMADE